MYIVYLFRLCWMSFYTNLLHIHVFMYSTLLKPAHQCPSIHTHAFHPFQCMHTNLPDSEEVLIDFHVLLFSQSLLSSFPRILSLAKLKCPSKHFNLTMWSCSFSRCFDPRPSLARESNPFVLESKDFSFRSLCETFVSGGVFHVVPLFHTPCKESW